MRVKKMNLKRMIKKKNQKYHKKLKIIKIKLNEK